MGFKPRKHRSEPKMGFCMPLQDPPAPKPVRDITRAAVRYDGISVSYTLVAEATEDDAPADCRTCGKRISDAERRRIELATDGLVATPHRCWVCAGKLAAE